MFWRLLVVAVVVFGVDAFWLEPSSLRAVEHDIMLSRAGIAPLRVAVIADLHAGSPYIDEVKVRRVVALANGAKPDLILLAGDYVAGERSGTDKYGQRYASGVIRENGKTLFVSTGIGTSILPVRLGVPRESRS